MTRGKALGALLAAGLAVGGLALVGARRGSSLAPTDSGAPGPLAGPAGAAAGAPSKASAGAPQVAAPLARRLIRRAAAEPKTAALPGSVRERVEKAVEAYAALLRAAPDPSDTSEVIRARVEARRSEADRLVGQLAALGAPGVEALVTFYLAGDTDPRLKALVAESLARIGEAGGDGLARLLQQEPDPRARLGLTACLERSQAKGLAATLLDLGETDADPVVRTNALGRLGERDVPAARLAAIARSDEDARVRGQATIALSRLPGRAGIDDLAALAMAASDAGVRRAAVDGLARIGGPEAVDRLAQLLRDSSDEAARREGVIVLARIGGDRANDAIRQALEHDGSESVRSQAAAAVAPPGQSQ